jgi:hypothetical protein
MHIGSTARRRVKRLLGVLLLATLPLARLAAAAPPDSGAILQQIQPVIPPAPSSTGTAHEEYGKVDA